MQTIKKINTSRAAVIAVCCAIFLFMLLCNFLTGMVSDDYSYCYSWTTGERITSIPDILVSLRQHYNTTNGRMIAHFFAHLFLMLPLPVFKFLNAGMFLLMLWLLYRFAVPKGQRSAVLLLVLFGLIWCTEPAFGEVNLWLDGACNYLWGGTVTLLYLSPMVLCICRGQPLSRSPWRAAVTMLLGLASGAYLENASAAAIFMAFLLLLLLRFYKKERIPVYLHVSFLLSIAGYLFMICAPGEHANKYGGLTLAALRQNFLAALEGYRSFWPLLLVLGCLFALSLHHQHGGQKRWVALVLFLGSLAANFVFIFAAYYPLRGAFYSVVLLSAAIGLLLPELMETSGAAALSCAIWALMLVTTYQMAIGLNDLYETHCANRSVIATIEASKQAGELDVRVPRTPHKTGYTIVSTNCPDPDKWPNTVIARYYGIRSIAFVQDP